MTPWARFDDLVAGRALVCPPPYRLLAATSASDVPGVLAEVERATAGGDWAFGYVSYEAAPGFDPALVTAAPGADDPPLACFGLCGEPMEATPGAAASPTPGTGWAGSYRPGTTLSDGRPQGAAPASWTPDWTAAEHARAVAGVR